MSNLTDIEVKAKAEIAKIEDVAVKEWLAIKAKSFSGKTVVIVAAVAFVLGMIVHLV